MFEGYMKKDEVQVDGEATRFVSCPNSIAFRHNNPGNLRLWGKYPKLKGYVVFPTNELGWAALYKQVHKNIHRGLTLREFFAGKPGVYGGYAPSADGNSPVRYAKFVSSHMRKYTSTAQGIDQELKGLINEETPSKL
jgi:hypothetical protein